MISDEEFMKALKALSEPTRLEIIRRVRQQQCEAGVACTNILANLDISQSTFSHHVSELRTANILIGEPEGRTVKLTLNWDALEAIQKKIDELR